MFKFKDTFYYLKNKLKNKSFLLYIELGVFLIIGIIAVFIAYSSFTTGDKNSRDATRLAHLLTISDELKIYYSKNNNYPLPEGNVIITSSGEILTYQGYFGKTISDTLKISKITDPIHDKNYKYLNYYTYSINEKKQNFQLMGFMEKIGNNLVNPLFKRNPFSYGENVGIFIEQETNRPIQETKLGIDLIKIKQEDYIFYLGDKLSNYSVITSYTENSIIKSCKEIIDAGIKDDGYFYINPMVGTSYEKFNKAVKVYCDMKSDGGGWTRLYYKNGKETCFNDGITYNSIMLQKLFTKDFAVSDKLETIKSEGSWLLKDIDFKYKEFDFGKMTNVANCKAPSGDKWSYTYDKGYVGLMGILQTMGTWKTMFYGCDYIKSIGDKNVLFNIGGMAKYNMTGEFIHSLCNNYSSNNHSITSRWTDNNTRVIWVR